MECLVCANNIVLEGFSSLLQLREPKLCGKCASHLKTGRQQAILEGNDWLLDVISRLDRGDTALLECLVPVIAKTLPRRLNGRKLVAGQVAGELDSDWLPLLVDQLNGKPCRRKKQEATLSLCSEVTDFSVFTRNSGSDLFTK